MTDWMLTSRALWAPSHACRVCSHPKASPRARCVPTLPDDISDSAPEPRGCSIHPAWGLKTSLKRTIHLIKHKFPTPPPPFPPPFESWWGILRLFLTLFKICVLFECQRWHFCESKQKPRAALWLLPEDFCQPNAFYLKWRSLEF